MQKIRGILKQLKVSCEDISPLISESMDHRVALEKRLRIKFHLLICGACQCYKTQMDIIKNLAKKIGSEDIELKKGSALRPETKEKIKQSLKSIS